MEHKPPRTPPPHSAGASPPRAAHPFTFRGVAAFAVHPWGRLCAVALACAILAGGAISFSFGRRWGPVLEEAVSRLPEGASINDGELVWPGTEHQVLGENSALAIVANPSASSRVGQSADLQIEFHPNALAVSSLFGSTFLAYPRGYVILLSRSDLAPLWGAWQPAFLALLGAVVALCLLVLWWTAAFVLCWPLVVYGRLLRRQATWRGCWRLGVGALLAGGLMMGAGILLYGLGQVTLVDLLAITALHLGLDLAYLVGAPFCLPRRGPTEEAHEEAGGQTPRPLPTPQQAASQSPQSSALHAAEAGMGPGSLESDRE